MVILLEGKVWKESTLLINYLWENWRDYLQWRRVRLGILPSHELAKMYMVTLRWADAIVWDHVNDELVLIEAKLRTDSGAVGQLKLYKELLKRTPEFSQYAGKRIRLVFLCPTLDMNLAQLCSKEGIDYVIWPEISQSSEATS